MRYSIARVQIGGASYSRLLVLNSLILVLIYDCLGI